MRSDYCHWPKKFQTNGQNRERKDPLLDAVITASNGNRENKSNNNFDNYRNCGNWRVCQFFRENIVVRCSARLGETHGLRESAGNAIARRRNLGPL